MLSGCRLSFYHVFPMGLQGRPDGDKILKWPALNFLYELFSVKNLTMLVFFFNEIFQYLIDKIMSKRIYKCQ